MPSDFELAQLEKVASIIYIIGSIITIISANKTQQIEVQKQISDGNSPSTQITTSPPSPTQLSVLINSIFLVGNTLFGQIAYTRLKKVQEGIQAGTETGTAIPNIDITFGWILAILGSLSRVIGSKLRAEQQQTITIL